MKKTIKKIVSLMLSAAVLGVTMLTGIPADAAVQDPLVSNQTLTGDATYVGTYMKSDYYTEGCTGFEITFKYNSLGTPANDLGFNETFQFLVFDSDWGGWKATAVGPNGYDQTAAVTPETNKEYTVTVPISQIESKLDTGKAVQGINLQTGGIGDTSVTLVSLRYVTGQIASVPTTLTGSWHKTGVESDTEEQYGTMSLESGYATVYPNPWNIVVSNFSVATFESPMVAVTVEYGEVTGDPIYPQAEILSGDTSQPIVPNYPQVSEGGEVTYLTAIPTTLTSMTLAYDSCTVKKVEIYDENESYTTEKTGLTNSNIVAAMGAGWNLGNALESNSEGTVEETLWGNPAVNKRLFKNAAAEGFGTVRIPTSWMDTVTVNGDTYTIDEAEFSARLNRLKEVVDMAIDYDMFAIVNIMHDGAEGVTGSWLDIDAENQTGIRNAFEEIWRRIAECFKSYDQSVIFESMNEVMENGNYGAPQNANTWTNINTLNQLFVNKVRSVGEGNATRFLMVPGYNTNIDQTVSSGFVMPTYNGSKANEIVSVHFYDPYNFTLNTGTGSVTTVTSAELEAIGTQFEELYYKFVDQGIPVFVGEFAAVDKGNLSAIKGYISQVVSAAQENGLAYAYWDNGYTGEYGMGLWNRYTYGQTDLGKELIPVLTGSAAN